MQKVTTVFCQTSFEGIHNYPGAPDEVSYLRDPHRHMFGVRVEVEVFHNDRELEFIMLKHFVESFIDSVYSSHSNLGSTSCEQIAGDIAEQVQLRYPSLSGRDVTVTVDEDGENGSTVYLRRER